MMVDELVPLLKALADPTRLRIVQLLSGREELCVCELVEALEVPQYGVSRHLGVLRSAGLVVGWRQGKWMHYALRSDLSEAERGVLQAVCQSARRDPGARDDRARLAGSLRPRAACGKIQCP